MCVYIYIYIIYIYIYINNYVLLAILSVFKVVTILTPILRIAVRLNQIKDVPSKLGSMCVKRVQNDQLILAGCFHCWLIFLIV